MLRLYNRISFRSSAPLTFFTKVLGSCMIMVTPRSALSFLLLFASFTQVTADEDAQGVLSTSNELPSSSASSSSTTSVQSSSAATSVSAMSDLISPMMALASNTVPMGSITLSTSYLITSASYSDPPRISSTPSTAASGQPVVL